MKQTELEYSEKLIEKYNKIFCYNYKNQDEIVECAIIDVTNTIEAFEDKIAWNRLHLDDDVKYYKDVLQILKDKL